MTLKSLAERFFRSVSSDLTGLRSAQVIPILRRAIQSPVELQASSKANQLRGGDAIQPSPNQVDSWMSLQTLLELSFLCERPVCIPHGFELTPEAEDRGFSHGPYRSQQG